jgi:hypothetical protein
MVGSYHRREVTIFESVNWSMDNKVSLEHLPRLTTLHEMPRPKNPTNMHFLKYFKGLV